MSQRFRKGDRVEWTGVLQLGVKGTVKVTAKADDIRVLVQWDGSPEPHLEWRHFLVRKESA